MFIVLEYSKLFCYLILAKIKCRLLEEIRVCGYLYHYFVIYSELFDLFDNLLRNSIQ